MGKPTQKHNINQTIIFLMMANPDVLEKHEELIYPFVSFVAEFGGSLGLFLGFSFMTIYDLMLLFVKAQF